MRHRPSISAVALAAALLTGCSAQGDASPHGARPTASPTTRTESTAGATPEATSGSRGKNAAVDPAAQAYVDAVAREDLDALVRAFRPDARLIDVDRTFNGRDEIRDWARDEVIGGRLTVLKNTPTRDGTTLLVRFAPGGRGGFKAHYAFDVRDGRIARLNLQYA
ncbi:nuclear transport factor 2 family protein [Streptomyces sp. NPDC007088]|uniref:nuclear transport factor 2 family protein n=1 Tax=Streptomyces sp. NPDC007088 TaxID=3364773 RepID=UPI0036B5E548